MTVAVDTQDTIAAIATAAGSAGVGIVRVSGPKAWNIAEALSRLTPVHREARLATLRDDNDEPLDQALVLAFRAPHSFTGEDIAEFHCHGGPIILNRVLRECLHRGARQAQGGEFTQRAFLNDKIDLVQAEAIADLIASTTEAAARSATRSLSGAFSRRVDALFQELVRLRVFVEAAIDFPEEEIDFIAESDVLEQLQSLEDNLSDLLDTARRGRRLRDGLKLVIAGAPNAGKSSLLNQLAEQDTAIVTNIPGTTRDVLREHIQVDGLPLHIVDTAGLRDAPDEIEREGIRRARLEMDSADRILLVVDDSREPRLATADHLARHRDDLPHGVPITLIRNKSDLAGTTPGLAKDDDTAVVCLSAQSGAGLQDLRQHLLAIAGLASADGSDFSARERHVLALEDCADHLERGHAALRHHGAAELIAEDLRMAQDSLGMITGRFSSDELLGEIFSSFCIGK